jgi:hypothetical protein
VSRQKVLCNDGAGVSRVIAGALVMKMDDHSLNVLTCTVAHAWSQREQKNASTLRSGMRGQAALSPNFMRFQNAAASVPDARFGLCTTI